MQKGPCLYLSVQKPRSLLNLLCSTSWGGGIRVTAVGRSRENRWPNIDQQSIPLNTHHIRLKLGVYRVCSPFSCGQGIYRVCSPFSYGQCMWGALPLLLPPIPIPAFLNPVPVFCRVRARTSGHLPCSSRGAATAACNCTQCCFVYIELFLILEVIIYINMQYYI